MNKDYLRHMAETGYRFISKTNEEWINDPSWYYISAEGESKPVSMEELPVILLPDLWYGMQALADRIKKKIEDEKTTITTEWKRLEKIQQELYPELYKQ